MNCKQGDLVFYAGVRIEALGHIATITRADPVFLGAWVLDPPIPNARNSLGSVWDSSLRPIRDPGDDAVDEVLQRIPSPFKTKETA